MQGFVHGVAERLKRGLVDLEKHAVAVATGFEQACFFQVVDVPGAGGLREWQGGNDVHAGHFSLSRQMAENADARGVRQGFGKRSQGYG